MTFMTPGSAHQASPGANHGKRKTFAQHESNHRTGTRPQRHADTDFVGSLHDCSMQQTVDTEGRKK